MTNDMLQGIMEDLTIAPTAEVTRDRYGYRVNGEYLRRVTTLLRGIPKDWLGNWAAKTVAEFAYDNRDAWWTLSRTDAVKLLKGSPWSKRDDAGDRGAAIHNALEAFARKSELPDMTEDEAACARAAIRFLRERSSRILGAEITVYNLTMGYAGTFDLWDLLDSTSWILDYKSSSGVYAEHAVQQVAYKRAEFAIVQAEGSDEKWSGKVIPWKDVIDRVGIVHVEPDKATLYPIREDVEERLWKVFRAAAFMKKWQSDVDSFAGKTPREHIYEDSIEVLSEKPETETEEQVA